MPLDRNIVLISKECNTDLAYNFKRVEEQVDYDHCNTDYPSGPCKIINRDIRSAG